MNNNPEIEKEILEKLRTMGFKVSLGGQRYSGNEEWHNWYLVGLNDTTIFGELEFSANPVISTLCFHCRGHGFDPWLGN